MRAPLPGICERCGADRHVHDGLCRHCRKVLLGDGRRLAEEPGRPPHQAEAEPLHSPPWRRRGA